MKIQGTVAQLERKPGTATPLAFWLVTAKDKIPVESGVDSPIAEGETVEVVGDTNSNGTLIAQAISKVTAAPPGPFPWKPVLVAAVVLIAVYGVYQLLQPAANSTYTVRATHCNIAEPNVTVTLTNAKGVTLTEPTNSVGLSTFSKLTAGTYSLQAGVARRAGIVIDGKTAYPVVTIDTTGSDLCVIPHKPIPFNPKLFEEIEKSKPAPAK
ncbi:hypothetical protein SBA3_290013 [Candidatus Sulfopaludibacter sp. SbA3]|nr:hypothetical protein SBA3_290013 [Candidatus Sulfopaludibacter sp. SbA3]